MKTVSESVFTHPEKFTQSEIANLRSKIVAFGQTLIGRRIVCPICDNLDLNYLRKVNREITGLTTNKPLKKCMVETVDILSVDIVKNVNDQVMIQFNGDPELQFDLKSDITNITAATTDDVHEALRKYAATKERTPFYNVKMVTDVVTAENNNTRNLIISMVDELMSQGASLEVINKATQDDTQSYYESLGE
jgi:hypothetical protein